jgi:hypothetical protein
MWDRLSPTDVPACRFRGEPNRLPRGGGATPCQALSAPSVIPVLAPFVTEETPVAQITNIAIAKAFFKTSLPRSTSGNPIDTCADE